MKLWVNKKYSTVIFIAIILIAVVIYYYFTNSQKSLLVVDTFSRNITWDSWLSKNVPYKKWDKIEIVNILSWWDYLLKLDLTSIKSKINIESINKDWKELTENEINNFTLNSDKPSVIKIKWTSKTQNDWNSLKVLPSIKKILQKISIKDDKEHVDISNVASEIQLRETNFNSSFNNLLEISWNNLKTIKFIMIWETNFKPIFDSWKLYIQIDKYLFQTWDYFVLMQMQNWTIKTIDSKIHFDYSPWNINIWKIMPNIIDNRTDKYILIQWNWFLKLVSIQLSNNMILKNTEFKVINDNVISIKIPNWITPWKYKFNLMDINWIYEDKTNILTINN